jgi:SAM-dependent methyltransferase
MRGFAETYSWIKRWNAIRYDVQSSKRRLLSSTALTMEEKGILDKVSLRIHNSDSMYIDNNAFRYLSVGLSASRCIREILSLTPAGYRVESILDFASGHGRVLRFLRAMFPDSDITAAEIDSTALDFCRRSFSTRILSSKANFSDLSLSRKFDLIWCGSLCTHIAEQVCSDLLQFFRNNLSDRGVCVFTTHGQLSIDWIRSGKKLYGLTEEGQQKVIQEFQSLGYGYSDYPNQSGYGISAVSHQRMLELANGVGKWSEVFFLEHGWDNHQDVYAFVND